MQELRVSIRFSTLIRRLPLFRVKIEAIGRFRVEAVSFTSNAQHEPYLKNMSPSASDEFFANEWKAAYERHLSM